MQQVAATHHIPHSCLKSWGKLDEYLAPNCVSFRSALTITNPLSKPPLPAEHNNFVRQQNDNGS